MTGFISLLRTDLNHLNTDVFRPLPLTQISRLFRIISCRIFRRLPLVFVSFSDALSTSVNWKWKSISNPTQNIDRPRIFTWRVCSVVVSVTYSSLTLTHKLHRRA